MLPQKYRLTVTQFNQIPQKSVEYKTLFFSIKIKTQTKEMYPKFVVITPKSIDGRSSRRHLTKRIILEIIYKEIKNIKRPVSVLIKAWKIINKQDKYNIEKEIRYLFNEANLLSPVEKFRK